MESSNKKRLGVFRAITRDISPDYCAIPVPSNSFQPPPHFPNASGPLLSSDTSHVPPHSMASNSDSYFSTDSHQTAPADYSVRVCPLVKTSRDIQISRNFEQKLAQHLDPKKEFLLPFAMNKLENRYYESPLNSSGSISSRSFIMNNSTEESSREETDERRKPKKRPLEEGEKNFYVIKLDAISKGEDSRTTVMIKNIPNKYTQKMLLQTINKKFAGTYDFLYLPIDFKVRDI